MALRRRGFAGVGAMIFASLALAACGSSDDSGTEVSGDGLQTIEQGTLTVGSDIPYKPFEFGQPPYEGFDIDVVNAIGDQLGLEVKFVKTPFDTIFRDVAQGRFDMVASAATITPEREQTVDFSDPYFAADQSLVVTESSTITSVDDLAGQTIGAQLGTTGETYANDETDAAEVRTYDLVDDAFQALQAGQIEAAIIDYPVAQAAQDEGEGISVATTIPTGESYGIAFSKDTPDLRDAVNEALQELKDDGTYASIFEDWFNDQPPASVLKPASGK